MNTVANIFFYDTDSNQRVWQDRKAFVPTVVPYEQCRNCCGE